MTESKKPTTAEEEDVIRSKLDEIYSEMRSRNKSAILKAGAMRCDNFFSENPGRTDDDRRCLAISAVMDESMPCSFSSHYDRLTKTLLKEFPNDLHFAQSVNNWSQQGQLHWTAMQLVGFADYEEECSSHEDSAYFQQEYLNCIQDSLHLGGLDRAFTIHYVGVIAVSTGLLMIGVPSIDLNIARDALRTKLASRGLPLKEPFVNNICHSTLFRVTNLQQPSQHARLLQIAKDYENVHLGTVTIQNLQVGPASWRMLSSEIKATPPLRKWALPVNTPTQEYCNQVLQQTRSVFTVSGASGVGLAKEVQRTLLLQNTSKDEQDENTLLNQQENNRTSPTPVHHGGGGDNVFDHFQDVKERSESPLAVADHSAINASTVSGAGGALLAQELQQMLKCEQTLLDAFYNRDFY